MSALRQQLRKDMLKIRIVIEKDDGYYLAYCPDLPGLAVEATEIEELKEHVHDAVLGYLESLIKHGDPIPVGVMEAEQAGIDLERVHAEDRASARDLAKNKGLVPQAMLSGVFVAGFVGVLYLLFGEGGSI